MNLCLRYSVLAGLLCFAGCNRGGLETVPVYGKVTFVGREVPQVCRLYFQPVESSGISRPSSATAKPDGSYEVKAFQHSKGLIPGTYQVQISYFDLKPGANPNIDTNWKESKFDAGELVVESGSGGVEHNIEVPQKSTPSSAATSFGGVEHNIEVPQKS